MELTKQVTSVALSNQLRKLFDAAGVQKPSIFYREWTGAKEAEVDMWGNIPDWCEDNVNCYTVADLEEILPQFILKDGFSFELQIVRSSAWRLYYGPPSMEQSIKFTASTNDTGANARAKFIIYLLENNLLTL